MPYVSYPPFEGSLPWFESKSNLGRLEYSFYTQFEHVLRNVRSEPIREVSVLFIRSRTQAISCSSLKLKMVSSLWDLWLVFECCQIVALKNAMHHREKGTITLSFRPTLCPSRGVLKEISRGNNSKETWD
jgi:hypothetical protein